MMHLARLTHHDYTVAWICPLEVEQSAAVEMLDQRHDRLPQPNNDHNAYLLGSIQDHNVVIAGLPGPGNSPAATVVAQMRGTFPRLRFGLLVGIGGGVPTRTDEGPIRLGHVVVSKPDWEHSGAVQYDRGKAEAGHFRRTGSLAPPPKVLLNAAQRLGVERRRARADPLIAHIARIDTSIRGLRRYKYPGAKRDHLYEADYVHLDKQSSCTNCGCDPSKRVSRYTEDSDDEEDLQDQSHYVVVHRGTIAAGEKVMKNGIERDRLAKEFGILCFEMEAAGALDDFPCLVIRGISDYSDSHKNDKWQGYAAAVAAAYARELFFHMPVNEVESCTVAKADFDHIKTGIDALVLQDQTSRQSQHHSRMLAWLCSFSFSANHNAARRKYQEGTFTWLFDREEFAYWCNTPSAILLLQGKAGAGKTIAASSIVHYLQRRYNNEKAAVVFTYCTYQNQLPVEEILAAHLKDLIDQCEIPPAILFELYSEHSRWQTRPTRTELLNALRQVATTFSRVFVVVDAFNEFGERVYLLDLIEQLQEFSNVLITSQPVSAVWDLYGHIPRMEFRPRDEDIEKFVQAEIRNNLELRARIRDVASLHQDSANRSTLLFESWIVDMITQKADGTFLLARLNSEAMTNSISPHHFEEAMNNLPRSLNSTYEQAMDRINAQSRRLKNLAKKVLAWLAFATRPLSLAEICHGLAVRDDSGSLDVGSLPSQQDIISSCAGLVEVRPDDDVVTLVHQSAQEFLDSRKNEYLPEAAAYIAITCIRYLSLDHLSQGPCISDDDMEIRLLEYPLLPYVAQNLGYHIRGYSETSIFDLALSFLTDEHKLASVVQAIYNTHMSKTTGWSQKFTRGMTGLHFTAWQGLLEVVKKLMSGNYVEPQACDDEGRTPIFWAVKGNHLDIVKLLLMVECNINRADNSGMTVLSHAAESGYASIVATLLERPDVDPNPKDMVYYKSRTPILWATAEGHVEVVKALLSCERCDPTIKDSMNWTPLSYATAKGHADMVQALLESDRVSPNVHHSDGWTPLCLAAQLGREDIVRHLLARRDIDPNLRNSADGASPLHYAVKHDYMCVVQLLLATNTIDINAGNAAGKTPLLVGAANRRLEIVRYLLESSLIDLTATTWAGDTALTCACDQARGRVAKDMVRLLLDSGRVESDCMTVFGETPLSFALYAEDKETMDLLLETGKINPRAIDTPLLRREIYPYKAEETRRSLENWLRGWDLSSRSSLRWLFTEIGLNNGDRCVNYRDDGGWSPISRAMREGDLERVKQLISVGADPNSRDPDGFTPLYWAIRRSDPSAVRLLLSTKGVNHECRDRNRRSPLSWAAEKGLDLVLPFQELGMLEPNSSDAQDYTPLVWSVKAGHLDVVKLLLECGADPLSKGEYKSMPIFWAVYHRRTDIVETLLTSGPLWNSEVDQGRKVLFQAIENGDMPTLQLLISTQKLNWNSADSDGYLPLSRAISGANDDVVQFLLDSGADPNLPDVTGRTMLIRAMKHGNKETLNLLLQTGRVNVIPAVSWLLNELTENNELSDIHETEAYLLLMLETIGPLPEEEKFLSGQTLLSIVAKLDLFRVTSHLLLSGASMYADTGPPDCSTLAILARTGQGQANRLAQVLSLLDSHHLLPPDINEKQIVSGKTILHWAARYACMEALKQLLPVPGIDCNQRDNDGRRAAHDAVVESSPQAATEVLNLLHASGADLFARDYVGKTPFNIVQSRAHTSSIYGSNHFVPESDYSHLLDLLDPRIAPNITAASPAEIWTGSDSDESVTVWTEDSDFDDGA